MEWGKKMKEARKAQHMTQQQLADKIGVNRSTIANYEMMRRKPTFIELKEIAKVLRLDVNYLTESETSPSDELLSRALNVFSDVDLPDSDKDQLFRDIMELYMKGKSESGGTSKRKQV